MADSLFFFFFIKKDTLALVFSCDFCELCMNTFVYRIPAVAASVTQKPARYDSVKHAGIQRFCPWKRKYRLEKSYV